MVLLLLYLFPECLRGGQKRTYSYSAGSSGFSQINDNANGYVIADTVKLKFSARVRCKWQGILYL